MAGKQREYTAEFKREAVRRLETSGKGGTQIAQELGISDSILYTWRKRLNRQRLHSSLGYVSPEIFEQIPEVCVF
jgi:transposase